MIKKYPVRLTQEAQNDLEKIFYYIADDSTNNAKHFILQLEEKVYSLESFPDYIFAKLIDELIYYVQCIES